MTEAVDRQHVRFLGSIIAYGFTAVALVLAMTFGAGPVPLAVAAAPTVAFLIGSRTEMQGLEEEAAPEAVADGGQEVDR